MAWNQWLQRLIFLSYKGGVDISLPITKEQFLDGVLKFINTYGRLPYIEEDDIEVSIVVKNGKKELRPYRASRYIKEYYNTQDKLTESLLDNKLITYKSIANTLGLTEVVTRNAITKQTKNPQAEVRRQLHMFFNKDLYKELGEYANLCSRCNKRCKQHYFVDVKCKNYKEKK